MRFEDFQDGHLGGPSQISDQNYFNNSESLCRSDVYQKFGLNLHSVWEEMSFEKFQDGAPMVAILDIGME